MYSVGSASYPYSMNFFSGAPLRNETIDSSLSLRPTTGPAQCAGSATPLLSLDIFSLSLFIFFFLFLPFTVANPSLALCNVQVSASGRHGHAMDRHYANF